MENIEQWGVPSGKGDLQLLRKESHTLKKYMCSNTQNRDGGWKYPPYKNFAHLTGRSKPWYKSRAILEEELHKKAFGDYTDVEYWYWLLKDALGQTGIGDDVPLDFISAEKKSPSVGKTPSFDQRAQYIRRKAQNGWRQYENEEMGKDSKMITLSVDRSVDTRKWAYAFLLGGARSNTRDADHIGGLYSVVTSTHQLRKLGSRADIVLMVQIAADSSHEKLSEWEEEILGKMNIRVVYIPKFADASMECFYSRKIHYFVYKDFVVLFVIK